MEVHQGDGKSGLLKLTCNEAYLSPTVLQTIILLLLPAKVSFLDGLPANQGF